MKTTVFWVETYIQYKDALNNRNPSDLIIILSEKVSLKEINRQSNCFYYDDKVDKENLHTANVKLENFLNSWFLNDGNDYTELEGLSFGLLFLPSIHYLYLSYLRYYLSLVRFLKLNSYDIKTFSNIHPCAMRAVELYSQQFSCNVEIQNVGEFKVDRDEFYQIELDYQGRQRDLSCLFKPLTFSTRIISYLQCNFLSKKKYKVLLTQGNKIQSTLTHGFTKTNTLEFLFPIPKKELFKGLFRFTKGYIELNALPRAHKPHTTFLEKEIEKKFLRKYKEDPFNAYFFDLLKNFIFRFFKPAFQKYKDYQSFFQKVKVEKVLFTADSHEHNLLLAMVTKSHGIKNLLTPHGLYGYGYPIFKHGKYKLFDEFIAFGNKDLEEYLRDGISKKNVHIAPLPHFANYQTRKINSKPPIAIILPLEYSNIALGSSLRDQKKYFVDVLDVLQELKIEVLGIKFRGEYALNPMRDDLAHIPNVQILDPSKPLGHYFDKASIVIGTSGSAMIESTLCGLKYYCCFTKNETLSNQFTYLKILDYYHTAHSKEELLHNIKNDLRFKSNRNINDLIELGENYTFSSIAAQYLKTIQVI